MGNFTVEPVKFQEGRLIILDQTRLPSEEVYEELQTKEAVWDAIYKLKVRGAPAIGVAAAYGLCVAVRGCGEDDLTGFSQCLREAAAYLASARPTAVNLSWALTRMTACFDRMQPRSVQQARRILLEEADRIREEDEAACLAMGENGLSLLEPGMGILTHCNAGALATSRYGTCLAPIYLGQERGYGFHVFADETRPLLQGARLTAWELQRSGVDVTLICDNMAAAVMAKGWIDAVVVGCDRMAANGDGANKIGTYGVAVLAKEHNIPFYMYVPTSTIDLTAASGSDIRIEERSGEEIRRLWYEKPMAPEGIKTFNPAFDVTPARYITAVITEKGVVRPPYGENLQKLFRK